MSQSSEHSSDDESSQNSSEYHSSMEPELERKQIILVSRDEEFTFLNIWFPLPLHFPNPYTQLNKLMSHIDHVVPTYDQIHNITN